jgi:hypothetical protein
VAAAWCLQTVGPALAQDAPPARVEAPSINVGDSWTFDKTTELRAGFIQARPLVDARGSKSRPRPIKGYDPAPRACRRARVPRTDARGLRAASGRRLVDAALDEARAREGVKLVQLTVTLGNDTAQLLYELSPRFPA